MNYRPSPPDVPKPRPSPKLQYSYGDLSPEGPSGVFHPRTGRTKRNVFWASVIGGALTLLAPVVKALADRIAPPPVDVQMAKELKALRELLTRDGGEP